MMTKAGQLRPGDEIEFGNHYETVTHIEEGGGGILRVHTTRTQPARPHRYAKAEKVRVIRFADGTPGESTHAPKPEPPFEGTASSLPYPGTDDPRLSTKEDRVAGDPHPRAVTTFHPGEDPSVRFAIGDGQSPPESLSDDYIASLPMPAEALEVGPGSTVTIPEPQVVQMAPIEHSVDWAHPGKRFKLQTRPYLAVGYYGDQCILYTKKADGERKFLTELDHQEMLNIIHLFYDVED